MVAKARATWVLGAVTAAMAGTALVAPGTAQAATGCSLTYAVTSQWSGGFVADVKVTNLGDALSSWALTWTFAAGEQVTSAWNATVTQSGTAVRASNASWNGALGTGGSAGFGFQGTFTGSAPGQITGAALNGVACTGTAGGGSTTTTRPPSSTTTTTTTRPVTTTTTTRAPSSTTTTTTRPATTTTTTTSAGSTWETLIDSSAFGSYAALEKEFNYLYPWGSDHNGSARMYASATDHNHVYLENGALVLKASRITWDEGNSTANPNPKIYYHSGAVYAKDQVVVTDKYPNWEVRGQFQAPSVRGTWPAFWLTGVNSWPPESDILEFKGDARNWFNTFRSSSDVSSTIVSVSNPGAWHEYRAWITKANATDVTIHYYVDGVWKGQHDAKGFVGKPMWLIINLQMEGSSGAPGPTADTFYRAKDVYVGRTNLG